MGAGLPGKLQLSSGAGSGFVLEARVKWRNLEAHTSTAIEGFFVM